MMAHSDGSAARGRSPGRDAQPPRQILGQFVSLRSVAAALGRRRRFWITLALAGFIMGVAAIVVLPKSYQARTTLVLLHNPADSPILDMANDLGLLETNKVAQRVVEVLKLPESGQTFLGQYQAVAVSDELLQVTVSAPSEGSALARAGALDTAFLEIRSALLTSQNDAVVKSLGLEAAQLSLETSKLTADINAAQSSGSRTSSKLSALTSERNGDVTQIAQLQQTIAGDDVATTSIITSSTVLDPPALVNASKLKKYIADPGSGLVAGLVLGCGIVIFEALAFERLRRRDDIARALGGPVSLAVPTFRRARVARIWTLRRSLKHPNRSVRLMAAALREQLDSVPSPAGLAVVEVDSTEAASLSIASLAQSLAAEGREVTILDCSQDRLVSKALGLRRAGTKMAFVGTPRPATVISQDAADLAFETSGALGRHLKAPPLGPQTTNVALALITLDPAIRCQYLSGWISNAVAVVTVGRSKETTLRSVAEMLEEAGIVLRSVIVVGADTDDDSLGRVLGSEDVSPASAVAAWNLEFAQPAELAD